MSNPATASTDIKKPLWDFHKIGETTYLYARDEDIPDSYTPKDPLILLFSWMGAAPKNIAKYTVAYRRLYPTARILLVRNEVADFFTDGPTCIKRLAPVYGVVNEHVKAGGDIMVHSFSNGGAKQLIAFAKLWAEREGSPFPMRAEILDSAPGAGRWKRSHAALAVSLPRFWPLRLLGSIMIHLFLLWHRILHLLGKEHVILTIRQELNNPSLFDKRAPRVYLYSKADEMVGDDEVEGHADEAEAQGWKVTRVRFERSPHAGHVREDEGKYWDAVQKAWAEGSRAA